MKRLVKRISLPLLLLAGLMLMGPQSAEASKWRRHVRQAHVHAHAHAHALRHVAPAVVYAPPVPVYAPVVGVYVGPAVHVRAPVVRVNVVAPHPPYHRGAYYRGW